MVVFRVIIWVGSVAAVALACGPGGPREPAGSNVPVTANSVDNPSALMQQWSVQPLRELARTDSPDLAFANITASLAGSGPSATLAVYDDLSGGILLFDSTGRQSAVVGSRGAGPGELEAPTGLGIMDDGSIVVFDLAKRALVRYTAQGKAMPQIPVDGVHTGGGIAYANQSFVLATSQIDRDAHALLKRLVVIDSVGGRSTVTLMRESLPRAHRITGCPRPLVLPRLFEARMTWGVHADQLALVRDSDYRIEVYRSGVLHHVITLDQRPTMATRELALLELASDAGNLALQGGCEIPNETLLRLRGMEERVPALRSIAVSPSGDVWAQRRGVGLELGSIDVFDSMGVRIAVLSRDSPFPLTLLDGNRYVSVRQEPDGDHLWIYAVIKGTTSSLPD